MDVGSNGSFYPLRTVTVNLPGQQLVWNNHAGSIHIRNDYGSSSQYDQFSASASLSTTAYGNEVGGIYVIAQDSNGTALRSESIADLYGVYGFPPLREFEALRIEMDFNSDSRFCNSSPPYDPGMDCYVRATVNGLFVFR